MKKWFVLLPLSLLAALSLFIVLSLFYDRSAPEKVDIQQPIQIVMKSMETNPMDFWEIVLRGMREAAKEYSLTYEISGPDFEKLIDVQIELLDAIIEQKPPMLLLAASDFNRLVPSVERASELGIPVIIFDSDVNSSIPISFIGTNNLEAGMKAGEEMKRLLQLSAVSESDVGTAPADETSPGDGGQTEKKVAIVSHIKEVATGIDREAGVREALDEDRILGSWYIDVERQKAFQVTMELLENPALGGIIALNEASALGVADAVQKAGRKDQVWVVGFDNALEELEYLESGVIDALVIQRPYNIGYVTVKTAAEFLMGKTVQPRIDTGSLLITKENMYNREYQELLFPVTISD